MHLSEYAPLMGLAMVAGAGGGGGGGRSQGTPLSGGGGGMVVEEPPDDDNDNNKSPTVEEGGGETTGDNTKSSDNNTNTAADKESSTESNNQHSNNQPNHQSPSNNKKTTTPYPECWFEDEASGIPLRWHLFVGVLYDLMKGHQAATFDKKSSWNSNSNGSTQHNFLPWRIRVHFTSYPTDRLLPLDDGLDHTTIINNNKNDDDDDGNRGRITNLLKRLFRNSLKQALFMQYASSKVAMGINKHSHGKIWNAVLESNYGEYHEVNVGLQSGIGAPSMISSSAQSSSPRGIVTTPLAGEGESSGDGDGVPQLIPVRLMVNGMPAIQKPIKHEKDAECKRPSEVLEKLGTYRAPMCTTLGDVLAGCLPDYFVVDPTTGCTTEVSHSSLYYCIQGVQPSMECALVDLWRALSHPDHFLYIIVVTE